MSNNAVEMPFLDHLRELRGCLVRMLIGIAVGMCLCLAWSEVLFQLLTYPVRIGFLGAKLIGTGPADAFIIKLKVAAFAGMLLSSPWSFYQLWRFISPGLHEHERKHAMPFVLCASIFFLSGVTFCFTIVLPYAFSFFNAEYQSLGVSPDLRIGEYLSFVLTLCFVFGGMFELPVLSYFLARMGILHYQWLIKNLRYAIVIIFIIAAILTPPDVVSQMLLAIPMLILFGMCIGIAYAFGPDRPLKTSSSKDRMIGGVPPSE